MIDKCSNNYIFISYVLSVSLVCIYSFKLVLFLEAVGIFLLVRTAFLEIRGFKC